MCDECGSGKAVIHLTQIVDDQMKTVHLCERCAAEKGVETGGGPENFPLSDFLAQMGAEDPVEEEEVSPSVRSETCSFCHMTFSDFREAGRLGCPHCYESFEPHLRSLLRRVHGSTQHVGKVYLPPDPSESERDQRLVGLRKKLKRAVEREDFERAAEIRDQIREMEPAGGGS